MSLARPAAVAATALLLAPLVHANTPPTISGAPPRTILPGQHYVFRPGAADADRNTLTFSMSNRPYWLWFDPKTGSIAGTAPSGAKPGTVWSNLVITVSDGRVSRSLPAFSITVAAATVSLAGTPPSTATLGTAFRFRPSLTAPAGTPVAFSIRNKPSWAQFSTATGELSGTPPAIAVHRDITISAATGSRTVALPAFTLSVMPGTSTATASRTFAASGSTSLVWTPPPALTDGRPLTGLAGYRVRYGSSPTTLNRMVQIANPGATAHTLTELTPGTWYLAVTAYTTTGIESALSAVVSTTIR